MKTRIFHTRFWQDEYITALTHKEKIAFIYLFTNEYVGIAGIYELSSRRAEFDIGLTPTEWQKIKERFERDGKFTFIGSWVKVVNVDKYNNYRFSEKNEKAFNRELELIPEEVRVIFGVDFTMEEFKEKHSKSNGMYIHRRVAERILGRKLENYEVVHHIDKDPSNNCPENLAVMSADTHQKLHKGEIDLSDTSITLVSDFQILVINHKSEIINKKEGGVGETTHMLDKDLELTVEQLKELKEKFPGVNLETELENLRDWLIYSRKPQPKDYWRFVLACLRKKQGEMPKSKEIFSERPYAGTLMPESEKKRMEEMIKNA